MNDYSTYALMDAALMADAENMLWMKGKRRPRWLVSLYDRPAWRVSPFIVDIDAAYRANRIDSVMELVNFMHPRIHVSFIDTTLSVHELADHLRQFGFITTDSGEELTLRVADCIVLPWLHDAMTPSQWAALHDPILAWRIHSREGKLSVLPAPGDFEPVVPPLNFTKLQLAALDLAHEPYQLMSNLRAMRFGHQWAETPQLEIQLAERTLKVWKDSGTTDSSILLTLALGVFDTKGKLLQLSDLGGLLGRDDPTLVERNIENAVARLQCGPI
ncbi:DUF4123 domain-containing protein [Pseudoduganella sp. HUAS MS19]